jgi:predicted RNA binding protein YcfA (HicA-like mRNA interferase family)
MPKRRALSGREVLTILREFGFQKFGQRGSHIKIRRVLEGGQVQALTVPNHDEIDRGTLVDSPRPVCGKRVSPPEHYPAGALMDRGASFVQYSEIACTW